MYNTSIAGFIPYLDDGAQKYLAVRIDVVPGGDLTLTVEADGELVTGLEMTEVSGVYTIAAGE